MQLAHGEGFFHGHQVNSHPSDTEPYQCAKIHAACHQTGWEGSVQEQAPNSPKDMLLGIFLYIESIGMQRKEVLSIKFSTSLGYHDCASLCLILLVYNHAIKASH